jgi:hypothetical protein
VKKKDTIVETSPTRLEGVQLCLMNAKRLLEDSDNVSLDTAVGLLELSLEEVAKGFMLYWRGGVSEEDYTKQIIAIKEYLKETNLSDMEKSNVLKFYEEEGYRLFEALTVEQYESHSEKLKYLGHLINLFTLVLLPALKMANIQKALNKFVSKFIRISHLDVFEANEDAVQLLERLNTLHITELKDLRENGFYVSYHDGHYFYPSSSQLHLEQLETLAEILISYLNGMLILWRKS